MDGLLARFESHATPELVDRAVVAVGELDSLAACDDMAARDAAGPEQSQRAAVDAVYEQLDRVQVQLAAGEFEDAAAGSAEAVRMARELGYEPALAQALGHASQALEQRGDRDAALASAHETFVLANKLGDDRLAAEATVRATWILAYWQHKFDETLALRPWAEGALARLDGSHDLRARHHKIIGVALDGKGRSSEALAAYELALDYATQSTTLDELELASHYNSVGRHLLEQTRFVDAGPYLERTLAMYEAQLGADHPTLSTPLTNLGSLATAVLDAPTAERMLSRALELDRAALGPDPMWVAHSEFNLATALTVGRHYDRAFALYDRSVAKIGELVGTDDPDYGMALLERGGARVAAGQLAAARRDIAQAVAIIAAKLGVDHPRMLIALAAEADLLRAERDCGGAIRRYERALDSDALSGFRRADLRLGLARCRRIDDPARAIADAERAVAVYADAGPALALRAAAPKFLLAQLLGAHRPGRLAEADTLARAAADAYAAAGPQWSPEVAAVRAWLDR